MTDFIDKLSIKMQETLMVLGTLFLEAAVVGVVCLVVLVLFVVAGIRQALNDREE